MSKLPFLSPIDLVRRFHELRVLVIGDALLDSYLEGDAARLSRDGPIPVVRKTTEMRLPGGAANVAANLQALGAHVSFLSVVGNDIAGTLLGKILRERTIDDQWLLKDQTLATPHKLRIVANGQHIARFDEGGTSAYACPADVQQKLFNSLDALYADVDALVVSDYGYGLLSPAIQDKIARLQQANPKPILVDAQELARFRQFPATIVTPNYQEALFFVENNNEHLSYVSGIAAPDNFPHVEQLARYIGSTLAAEHVAITLAEHGVFLLSDDEATHLPAHPVPHAHDIGAGDSFASALILAMAAGGPLKEAAQIALDAAGIAVTKPRTAIVSYQELLQRVSLRVYTDKVHEHEGSDLTTLLAQLEIERLAGHRIAFTNGVFDVLHVGHIQFLRQAKAQGDILVVGINSDAGSRRIKGAGRPINTEQDRLALVQALDMVDYSFLFDGDTATTLIEQLRPDIYVKGGDYTNETLPEADIVTQIGGKIVILPLVGSRAARQILQQAGNHE